MKDFVTCVKPQLAEDSGVTLDGRRNLTTSTQGPTFLYMRSFSRAILSFFGPRSRLVDPTTMLLDPHCNMNTDNFLYTYISWASTPPSESKKYKFTSNNILQEFNIVCVMHNTLPATPEHDFLVIDTKDKVGNHRFFLLDRTVIGEGQDTDPTTDTLSPTQTADFLINSVDESPETPATDRILGQSYVISPTWSGQNLQYFHPNGMSLFQFVVLAEVVHNLHPTCSSSLLGKQCFFFYVDLVYTAAKHHFGSYPIHSNVDKTQDLVYVYDSHLSNKFVRYKGFKISKVTQEQVSEVITAFLNVHSEEVSSVFIYLCSLIHISTYFTGRAQVRSASGSEDIESSEGRSHGTGLDDLQ